MKQVLVVFTEHEEDGAANSANLLAILADIEPNLIFLECPRASLEDYLKGRHAKLEPLAISQYRATRAVELVPVDIPVPRDAEFARMPELLNRVARIELDYDRYTSWHKTYVTVHGFSYLNSKYCSDLAMKRHELILRAMAKLDDQELTGCYRAWSQIHSEREQAMISSIEDHCRGGSFGQAVFLIGAGHRQSILERTSISSRNVQWNFLTVQEFTDHSGAA